MTSLRIKKGSLPDTVQVPSSKSYANRLLILGALKEGPFTIHGLPKAKDVTWMESALETIGLKLDRSDGLTIVNSFPRCEGKGCDIEVGEGGTTARFLASLLLLGRAPYTLVLGGRLKDRPWQEFIDFVRKNGGMAELIENKLTVQGPLLLPPEVKVDCSRTTQFASAIALSFHRITKVIPVDMTSSQSYWKMTEELISAAQSETSFTVPLDWSSASYPMAFAALNQRTFFPGLFFDANQADAKFLLLLEDLGAITHRPDGIEVRKVVSVENVQLDVSDCLDLVPSLGYFLSHVKGTHRLTGVQNLIHKESDRLQGVIDLLNCFNRKSFVDSNDLIIEGNDFLLSKPVDLTVADDHRMVMAGALFLRHHSGGTISPAPAVTKSFPLFFDLFSV